MRTLYYAPILHAIEDYFEMAPAIFESAKKTIGEDEFNKQQEQIRARWKLLEEKIENLFPDAAGLIIYQDSLPADSREATMAIFNRIVNYYPISPNWQLIKKLVDRGAILEGTENAELAKEQLVICKKITQAATLREKQEIRDYYAERSCELLKLRDEFIAQRIIDTLSEGGTGLLFVGQNHDADFELQKFLGEFKIIYL